MASVNIDKLTSSVEIEPYAGSPKNVADFFQITKDDEFCKDTETCRIFNCSKCGYGIEDIYLNDEGNYSVNPKYCPNCGREILNKKE